MAKSQSITKSTVKGTPKRETLRYPDGVEIALVVLEEIKAASESLNSTVKLFRETKDTTLQRAANILEPIAEKLADAISNEFPELDLIRKEIEKKGGEIRG